MRGLPTPGSLQPQSKDQLHDLAVYLVTGFALGFLVWGASQALSELVRSFVVEQARSGRVLLAGPAGLRWTIWGSISAWVLSGGAVWTAIWAYDLRRRGRRSWRVAYLYFVLIVAAPAALGGLTYGSYELLRRAFGYAPTIGSWDFLQIALPLVMVGGGTWLYHSIVLWQQANLGLEVVEAVAPPADAIVWPRRPAIALLSLLGVAAATPAFVGLIWVALDFVFNSPVVLSGPEWWRDRLSLSLAAAVIGTVTWLVAWSRLERAAADKPEVEHSALARRLYLGFITLGGALVALGFLVALLWLLLRLLLGEPSSAQVTTNAFKYFAATFVGAALAGYHAAVLRADFGWLRVEVKRPHLFVLLEPGAQGALETLKHEAKADVRVLGEVRGSATGANVGLSDLIGAAARMESEDQADGELVILGPSGGLLYPYGGKGPRR